MLTRAQLQTMRGYALVLTASRSLADALTEAALILAPCDLPEGLANVQRVFRSDDAWRVWDGWAIRCVAAEPSFVRTGFWSLDDDARGALFLTIATPLSGAEVARVGQCWPGLIETHAGRAATALGHANAGREGAAASASVFVFGPARHQSARIPRRTSPTRR